MNRENQMADPGGAMMFCFSMLVIMIWGIYQGLFTKDVYLLFGCIMLCVFPIYIIGAVIYAKRGDAFMSNIYFIFGLLFCGITGACYIALFFGHVNGWELDAAILGLPMIWGGLSILPMVIPMKRGPYVPFIVYSLCIIWLFTYGLECFGIGIPMLYTINKWFSLVVGLGTAYMFLSDISLASGGRAFPMGMPAQATEVAGSVEGLS